MIGGIIITSVYKITNKINQKIYIGISKNPQARWKQECSEGNAKFQLISKAIQKYGKENFSFEILETYENEKEALQREYELVNEYRSIFPYGYNMVPGGGKPPLLKGEKNPMTKISEDLAKKIQKELVDFSIPLKTIVAQNKVTRDIVRHINDGDSWKNPNLSYPLRPNENILNEQRATIVKKMLKETNLSQSDIAKKVGWCRSAITMINIGKNHYDANEIYPLRSEKTPRKTYDNYRIAQLDMETEDLLAIYDSISEAASRAANNDLPGIRRCCEGSQRFCAGFKWSYLL